MTALTTYPTVYCSLLPPAGRRTRYAVIGGPCGACGGGRHIYYTRDPTHAGGARRAGCGRGIVWLVIARRYTASAAVAA
jgi:hypothetical protein